MKLHHVLSSTTARFEGDERADFARKTRASFVVNSVVSYQQSFVLEHLHALIALIDEPGVVDEAVLFQLPLPIELRWAIRTLIDHAFVFRIVNVLVVPLPKLFSFEGFEANCAAERLLLSLLRMLIPYVSLDVSL